MITELERICKEDLTQQLFFLEADLDEANLGLDQYKEAKFPLLLFVTTSQNRSEKIQSDVIMRKALVRAMILDVRRGSDEATQDYESAKLNAQLNQLRLLGENLWYRINRSRLSVNGGVDKWNSDPIYEKFDQALVGQALSFDWSIATGSTGYYTPAGS